MDRETLEARWLELTRAALPALAAARGWPVRADHCFQRILLDNALGGVWYDHVPARPAYRHVALPALARAVALAEAAIAGTADLAMLNRRSLAWRAARRGDPSSRPAIDSSGSAVGARGGRAGEAAAAPQQARFCNSYKQ